MGEERERQSKCQKIHLISNITMIKNGRLLIGPGADEDGKLLELRIDNSWFFSFPQLNEE